MNNPVLNLDIIVPNPIRRNPYRMARAHRVPVRARAHRIGNRLKLAVKHLSHPNYVLDPHFVELFRNEVYEEIYLIDPALKPRILYIISEQGYMVINCANERSVRWIRKKIRLSGRPLKVLLAYKLLK